MSSPFQTKQFLALQKKWNKKLEEDGLADIDTPDGNLKGSSHADFFRSRYNEISAQAKQEYYQAAGYFLYEYKFASELDRKIWELHADGVSIRDIVKILKKQEYKVYKRLVHEKLRAMVDLLFKKMKVT